MIERDERGLPTPTVVYSEPGEIMLPGVDENTYKPNPLCRFWDGESWTPRPDIEGSVRAYSDGVWPSVWDLNAPEPPGSELGGIWHTAADRPPPPLIGY